MKIGETSMTNDTNAKEIKKRIEFIIINTFIVQLLQS